MSDIQNVSAVTEDTEPSTPASATATVEVPAEHEGLVQRVVALLERGEAWIKDNVEAGVTHFENMFGDKTEEAPKQDDTPAS
jgi:ABC-type nitrate/sulfonate/bicarbonate transport system substrate-binding protein